LGGSSVSSKARANRGLGFKRLWFPQMNAHMELGGKHRRIGYPLRLLLGRSLVVAAEREKASKTIPVQP
jgi:hypothetical protein